ncbi:RHS repeat-associated core domain-containing protein [Streptomyces sp. NBRC 109706]|uniref:RHS repeat-associated core domain-containing protein n=1 Tax=Streptomyces sp. NBRC 109706 TaxID=1550035 RepID=UPI000A75173B|nr:RHS repeat-associated core domain-containing protein [Streptomyces sp. NBRC 109706]
MDHDPTPGDPDEVRELADDLQEFADDVGEALAKIRGMAGERAMLEWAGLSAEAFRREFDGVPDNLTKLEDSYCLCSQALHTYWPKLQTAQGMADRALDRAITAQADLVSAQSTLGDATDWVGRAGEEAERLQREGEREGAEPPDEAHVRSAARDQQAAEAAAGAARSRVNDAEERLSAARQLALDAQEMREEAARECARDIDEASDAGIQNRRWWEKAIKWVTDNWDTLVEICKVIVAVLGVVVLIIGGPLAWVVLAAALVVLADTLIKYARGEAGLLDVAFAALDCIPGMKGITTLGGLAQGLRGGLRAARTGLRGYAGNLRNLGRMWEAEGIRGVGKVLVGDPIDIATGEMTLHNVDLELPGVLALILQREHLSGYRHGHWFGRSWASTLDQRLVLDEYGVDFYAEDGMRLHYPVPLADPDYPVLPVTGPRWSLAWDGQPGGVFTLHQRARGRALHFAPVPGRPAGELPLIAVTDRNGNRIEVTYDEEGSPHEVAHSGGYRVGVAVHEGRVTALTLLSAQDTPLLRAFEYDEAGNLAKVYNSSGLPLTFAYDDQHRMTRWEDRNGTCYRYEYDASGRCVYTTGTDRALEYRYSYDEAALRTTATNSLGHATIYQLNDRFRLVAETDPLGHTTYREWDENNHLVARTDALGRTTRHEHDDQGNVTLTTRPDGSHVRSKYNEFGLPVEVTQADGTAWQHSYDAAGNRVATVDPEGRRTRMAYDEHGAVVSVTDPTGRTTWVRCDATGLPISLTDAMGETTRYDRDAFGRLVGVTDPLGGEHRAAYTVEGHQVSLTDPLGSVQRWTWDAEGNCLTHVDEHGGTTRFSYGPFDQPISQTNPDGSHYTFERDTELRLVGVTGPHGLTWSYEYDAAHRLISETDFDGRTVTYALDATGQLIARTNAAGESVLLTRGVHSRIVRKDVGDLVTTYGYDEVGRLIHATVSGDELIIERDRLGRISRETFNGQSVTQSYDELGRPLVRVSPAGHTSTWAYDAVGRETALATGGRTLAFAHDAAGRETHRTIGPGVDMTFTWDAVGRLAREAVSTRDGTLRERSYAYRADHVLTGVTRPDEGEVSFLPDALGRITEVRTPMWRESYQYDAAGNQTAAKWDLVDDDGSQGDRFITGMRVVRAGRTHYEFDRAGRVTLKRKARLSRKADVWRYRWDAEDHLTGVVTPDGTTWRYRYDPLGRRIAKERLDASGDVVERTGFTWFGTDLVEQTTTEAENPSSVSLTWDYKNGRPIAQTESRRHPEYSKKEADARFYSIVTDLIGTPTDLVDESGRITWSARSTLWGVTSASADDRVSIPLRFPGQYADPETGWNYNFHRHYDPETARYTTPDPLGLEPSANHYTYVDNPHTWSDPFGLAAHQTPGINPSLVRFSQDEVSYRFSDGMTIAHVASGLRSGWLNPADFPAIRLVMREGNLFTLDNRRLVAFQMAGTPVPFRMATAAEAINESWKFTTVTDGMSIVIRERDEVWNIP